MTDEKHCYAAAPCSAPLTRVLGQQCVGAAPPILSARHLIWTLAMQQHQSAVAQISVAALNIIKNNLPTRLAISRSVRCPPLTLHNVLISSPAPTPPSECTPLQGGFATESSKATTARGVESIARPHAFCVCVCISPGVQYPPPPQGVGRRSAPRDTDA